jgi:uncharacterized protein YecE (DUF72 family)
LSDDQLGLFGVDVEVEPHIEEEDRELASRLPSFIRFGTSSWSFPGWAGLVWKGAPTEPQLARAGLAAYAQQPLFRTVGLDRTHYRPLRDEDLASYLGQLELARIKAPELPPFRVVSKVWDEITTAVFPSHPRSGARAGTKNPHFLDADVFLSQVLPPYSRVGARGPFVFEITPMPTSTMDERTFVGKVEQFLSRLPSGHRWAFELRNQELFTPRYVDMLDAHGASHVFNYWTAMPALCTQLAIVKRPPRFVVIRLMLPPFTKYETRKADFRPFDRLREIQSDMRDDVVQILLASANHGSSEAFVLVNNKAEGSSPLTIRELAKLTIRHFGR